MHVFAKKAAKIVEGCFVAYFALLPVLSVFAQAETSATAVQTIQNSQPVYNIKDYQGDPRYLGVEPGSWQARILDQLTPEAERDPNRTDIDYPVDNSYLKSTFPKPILAGQGAQTLPTPPTPGGGRLVNSLESRKKPGAMAFNPGKIQPQIQPKDPGNAAASQSQPVKIEGAETIMSESGNNFPGGNGWQVYDTNSGNGYDYWGSVGCVYPSYPYSIWSAGAGDMTDCSTYDNNMGAWMVYGPFDLSNAQQARVLLTYWFDLEANYDYFYFEVSGDYANWYGYNYTGYSGVNWSSYDSTELLQPYLGDNSVWLAFGLFSDSSNTRGGVYLDDISITKYTAPLAKPDLTAISPSNSSGVYAPGQYINGDLVIKNQGTASAPASRVYYYFGPDPNNFSSSYQVGHDDVSALSAGAAEQQSFNWQIPSDKSQGTYYFYYWIDAEQVVSESDENNNKGYWTITVQTKPDLAMFTGFLYPTDGVVYPGAYIQASIAVKNQGAAAAGSYHVYFYLKQGALVFDNAYRIADVAMPALAKDAVNSTETISYRLSSDLLPGTYTLYYLIDATYAVDEDVEWNNDGGWTLTVNPKPDLDRSAPRYNKLTFYPGEIINFDVDIINRGGTAAAASNVSYYFKQDSYVFSDDYRFITNNIPALSPGASTHQYVAYNIPANALPGAYYFYYWIDPGNTVDESNKSNNQHVQQITIIPRPVLSPDLAVSSQSTITGSFTRGQTIHGELTIKNIGNATAGSSRVYYYFKSGEPVYSSVYQVGHDDLNLLASQATETESFDWVVPATMAPGAYRFYYWLDAEQRVVEGSESNNYGGWDITIASSGLPDLTQYQAADLNTLSFEPGASLEMTVFLANNGSLSTGSAFEVRYYVEPVSSAGFTPASSAVRSVSIPALSAGARRSTSFSYQFPSNAAPGTYRVFYWIDATGSVAELNENNNIFYRDVLVAIPQGSGPDPGMADLAAAVFTPSVSSARLGDTLSLRLDIKNIGTAVTNAPGAVRVYFKQFPRLYTSDFEVGSGSFPRLGPQSSSSKYFSFTLPAAAPVGEYFVYYWIDQDGAIEESNENNNALFAPITVAAALSTVSEFRFSNIASPQQIGAPFNVAISARDASGNIVSGFSGNLGLGSNAGATSVRPSSVTLANGQWSGEVTMLKAGKDIYLQTGRNILSDISGRFDVASDAMGSISGRIIFSFDENVFQKSLSEDRHVRVYLKKSSDDSLINSIVTDHYVYTFSDVPYGEYKITAQHIASGAQSMSYTVYVGSEKGVTQDVFVPVCAGPNDKNPVLLVPGIMGSREKGYIWPVLPVSRNTRWSDNLLELAEIDIAMVERPGWNVLKSKLRQNGYVQGCNMFDVAYDWRLGLERTSGLFLKPWIDYAKLATKKDEVDIISHSMGGLLVRSYIQSGYYDNDNKDSVKEYQNDIDKFAMVGTPNKGSANAYYIWEGGDPKLADDITNSGLSGIINLYWRTTQYNFERDKGKRLWNYFGEKNLLSFSYIPMLEWYTGSSWNDFMPKGNKENNDTIFGAKQLLPTYGFLGNSFAKLENVKNEFLLRLNGKASEIDENESDDLTRFRMGSGPDKVDTAVFVGIKQSTINSIDVGASDSNAKRYVDGAPKSRFLGLVKRGGANFLPYGDGTVREDSASLPFIEEWARAKVTAESKHGGLINKFSDALVKFLKGLIPNGEKTLQEVMGVANTVAVDADAPTSILGFSFDGRITPHIISPSGKQSGIDANGDRVDEIPDAEINVRVDSGGIKINNPETGTYRLNIYSANQEDAMIHFEYLDAEAMLSKDYRIFTAATSTAYSFIVNPANPEKIITNQPISEPQAVNAKPVERAGDLATRLEWQAPAIGTAAQYRVYAKNPDDYYFSQIAQTEQMWLDTQDPWASEESDAPRLYSVSAVNASGSASFLSETIINNDQDNDGLADSQEVNYGTDATRPDTDGDGMTDNQEIANSTNPLVWDTDLDGYSDFEENEQGSDPLDENSTPPPDADLAVSVEPSFSSLPTGHTLTYSITASNNGPSSAQAVALADTLPESVVFVSASASQGACSHQSHVVACQIGTLASGASATSTIAVIPSTVGNITNTITITGNVADNNLANNTATTTTQVTAGRPIPPVVSNYPSFTNLAQTQVSGTKQADTSLWLNNQEIISRNGSTTWQYVLALSEGQNNFSFIAKDAASQESDPTNITITRDSIPPVAAQGLNAVSTGSSVVLSWNQYQTQESGPNTVYAAIVPGSEPIEPLAPHVAGEMLVRFKPGEEKELYRGWLSFLNFFKPEKSIEPIGDGISKVVLKDPADLEEILADYQDDDAVLAVSPNYLLTIDAIPNDPGFNQLWGLHNSGQTSGTIDADIDGPEAWDRASGSTNRTVVAVLDTGVDYTHPDLSANIWVNQDETAGNNIDDDNNGYVDDIRGWDATECSRFEPDGSCPEPKNQDNDPMDEHSHGTHVAGIIGAVGNNNLGIIGVNPQTIIMPVRFLDANGIGTTEGAIQALSYAVANGAQVVNASFGGPGFSQLFFDAIASANNAGVLFIASAGNDSENLDQAESFPAEYELENIISVAASDHNDNLALFSNFGANSVDLVAPGKSILSAVLNGNYGFKDGTSMAAPYVAGLASLLLARNPSLAVAHIRTALLSGVDAKGSLANKVITGGRLNANNSLGKLLTGIDSTSFVLYRQSEPFSSVSGLEPVAAITQSGAQSYEDNTVAPKAAYYYALAVKDAAGNASVPIFSNRAQTGLFGREAVSIFATVPQTIFNQGSSIFAAILNFFRR